jgi:hypothetical protein
MRRNPHSASRPALAAVTCALALLGAAALLFTQPAAQAQAQDSPGVTISLPPGGTVVAGDAITASLSTQGALQGNTPLDVGFQPADGAPASAVRVPVPYAILSAAGTTYTIRVVVPLLVPGPYVLDVQGEELASEIMSVPFMVAAGGAEATPTLTPVPTATPPPAVPSAPRDVKTLAAVGAASILLALSLIVLLLPPLLRRLRRRRGPDA